MPRWTLSSAGMLGACLLASCAGAPLKTAVPDGLVYDCTPGGVAVIRFNGGGYLPGSSVRAVAADGQPEQAARSLAQLDYAGATHVMVAEWAELGLRYRSREPVDGHYLIWTQRAEDPDVPETWSRADGPRGAEDVRLGRRADASASETDDEGEELALCRRRGRAPDPAEPLSAPRTGHSG